MTTFIRAADGATVSADEAIAADRTLRPGYRFGPAPTFLKSGEYARFDMAFRDTGGGAHRTMFYDTAPAGSRAAVDAARRAWIADKATAHLPASRFAAATPAPAAPPPSYAPPRPPMPPRQTNDTAARAAVADAKRMWLADKETAHLNPTRYDDF